MILQKEINAIAGQNIVRDTQIEKDYILTWLLYGLSKNEILSPILAFKGGTVLKKNYFEGYRFSEDLDYTLLDDLIVNETIKRELQQIFAFVKGEANITCQFDEKRSGVHKNGSLYFYVNYVGPLNASITSRDLKIDITRGETLEFEIITKKTFITYSDLPQESFDLKCYTLEEILIEKMVALMSRQEPRDLYDFWYLTEQENINPSEYKYYFERKAKNKGQNPSEFEAKVISRMDNFRRDWARKLEDQINDLPNFENVFREAKRHFKL